MKTETISVVQKLYKEIEAEARRQRQSKLTSGASKTTKTQPLPSVIIAMQSSKNSSELFYKRPESI